MVKAFALVGVHTLAEEGEVKDGKVLRPAKVAEHKPGAVFDVDQETLDQLEDEGAARKATRNEIADAQAKADAAAASRPRRTAQASVAPPADPLDSMTKEQLLEEAKTRGVEVKPAQSKDEILTALKAAG
jgi:hypothetical protein